MSEPTQPRVSIPSVFISYSWDSEEHKEWVLDFAKRLVAHGLQVTLDRWHLHLGADKLVFMEQAVQESDHVLLICTPTYKSKADGRRGGVGWEASIVTSELATDLNQTKFIPILREGDFASTLPRWIQSRLGEDFSGDQFPADAFERLLRALHNEPILPPPLGPRPNFVASPAAAQTPADRAALSCSFSPFAQIISDELSLRSFPLVSEASWSEQIGLTFPVTSVETDSAFARLRGAKRDVVLAYGLEVALARLAAIERISSGGQVSWRAKFVASSADFSDALEMGTTNISADQFAERRARRLLLNESPMALTDVPEFLVRANEAMTESLLQGLNSMRKVERSPFIELFREYGRNRQHFLNIAWISAVSDLKLSASVEYIDRLELGFAGSKLKVSFAGRRKRRYSNVAPYQIAIDGVLDLEA